MQGKNPPSFSSLSNSKNNGSVVAMIPARYAATRFPAKLMQMLGDKPVIRHTYEATVATGLFDEVVVVTDSDIIFNEITSHGGRAIKSKKNHECGTDRIAEAASDVDADVFLNVQGDEPFVKKEPLEKLLGLFGDPLVQVASLMQVIKDLSLINDPNCVKVAVDNKMNSLLFSRSPIPYPREKIIPITYYRHIGVYAFRKKPLVEFSKWKITPLEAAEKIECLRFLENGIPLRMAITDHAGVAIDTPEDLKKAIDLL
ncbi:MAG: 3-deoxy-manno-octulosonate cytidylyltransferase [Chitinophagales bacterium]|nr:3-deoxy-manno-octulosonate cytidylyltransferase [Chitinophagales bacterium]